MHTPKITPHVSLCSGYDGIGLGLKRVIPNLVTVAYCEREAYAVANLVQKIEGGLLDDAPIYTDVETFPYREFYPIMGATPSICSFGFPCQPHSAAGKRKGASDERWLFDAIADGLVLMRPGRVFIENVEGLLTSRMPSGQLCIDYIFARLAGIGYKMADRQGEPLIEMVSASEVGAPHQRKRVFILGELADTSTRRWRTPQRDNDARQSDIARGDTHKLEHTTSLGRREGRAESAREQGRSDAAESGPEGVADAESHNGRGEQQEAGERRGRSRPSGSSPELAHTHEPGPQGWQRGELPECAGELPLGKGGASELGDTAGTRGRKLPEPEGRLANSHIDRPGFGNEWPARPGEPQHEWEPPRVVTSPTVGRKDSKILTAYNEIDPESLPQEEIERLAAAGWTYENGTFRFVGRDFDGTPSAMDIRVDRLRLCGNGVVPAVAARAYLILKERSAIKIESPDSLK